MPLYAYQKNMRMIFTMKLNKHYLQFKMIKICLTKILRMIKNMLLQPPSNCFAPHIFRHTFATSLLEADVDIRYIQKIFGHSSINITEILHSVAFSQQHNILSAKHPMKDFRMYFILMYSSLQTFLTDNRRLFIIYNYSPPLFSSYISAQ